MKIKRSEISRKNPYYLPKHRYLELKHFCLQYDDWKRAVNEISLLSDATIEHSNDPNVSDPVGELADMREPYLERIALVDRIAKETDLVLSHYILIAVTSELTYENLRTVHGIPCCRNAYYDLYRKFFYILSKFR